MKSLPHPPRPIYHPRAGQPRSSPLGTRSRGHGGISGNEGIAPLNTGTRMMRLIATLLTVLAGCAGMDMNVETLKAEGYKRSREADRYKLWVKEDRGPERTVRACLVPKVEAAAYYWYLTILVDGRDTWSYESGPLPGKSEALSRRISCAVSPPLAQGHLNFDVAFRYRQ